MPSFDKTTVLIDKQLHAQLKQKIGKRAEISAVIGRLVEMLLKGEVKVTIPERQI